jgi:hypothetical protein
VGAPTLAPALALAYVLTSAPALADLLQDTPPWQDWPGSTRNPEAIEGDVQDGSGPNQEEAGHERGNVLSDNVHCECVRFVKHRQLT